MQMIRSSSPLFRLETKTRVREQLDRAIRIVRVGPEKMKSKSILEEYSADRRCWRSRTLLKWKRVKRTMIVIAEMNSLSMKLVRNLILRR